MLLQVSRHNGSLLWGKLRRAHREEPSKGLWLPAAAVRGSLTERPLYSDYTSWCASNGVTPKQQRAFTVAMQRKGYAYESRWLNGKTVRGFAGVEVSAKRPFAMTHDG